MYSLSPFWRNIFNCVVISKNLASKTWYMKIKVTSSLNWHYIYSCGQQDLMCILGIHFYWHLETWTEASISTYKIVWFIWINQELPVNFRVVSGFNWKCSGLLFQMSSDQCRESIRTKIYKISHGGHGCINRTYWIHQILKAPFITNSKRINNAFILG